MLYKITFCLSTHYTPKWQLVHFLEITCKNTLFLALLQAKSQKIIKSGTPCRRPRAEVCRRRWWLWGMLGLYAWCGGALIVFCIWYIVSYFCLLIWILEERQFLQQHYELLYLMI